MLAQPAEKQKAGGHWVVGQFPVTALIRRRRPANRFGDNALFFVALGGYAGNVSL